MNWALDVCSRSGAGRTYNVSPRNVRGAVERPIVFGLLACSLIMNGCSTPPLPAVGHPQALKIQPEQPSKLTRITLPADYDDDVEVCVQTNATMKFADPFLTSDKVCIGTMWDLRSMAVHSRSAN